MNPAAIAQLIAQLLPYGIEFVTEMVKLIHTQNPTVDDWVAALSKAQTPFAQGLNPGVLIPNPTPASTTVTVTTTPPPQPPAQ